MTKSAGNFPQFESSVPRSVQTAFFDAVRNINSIMARVDALESRPVSSSSMPIQSTPKMQSVSSKGATYAGTHLLRMSYFASSYKNVLFVETDRGDSAYYSDGTKWVYLFGGPYPIYTIDINTLNGTMTSGDLGFAIKVEDRNNVIYRYSTVLSNLVWKYESGGPYEITSASISSIITNGILGIAADSLGAKDTGLPIKITDRGNVIYTWNGSAFIYTSGSPYGVTQAGLSGLSFLGGVLTINDNGVTVHVTDYDHFLQWDGSSSKWTWMKPGDDGLAGLGPFFAEVDPGTGWHLYDGATVNYLKADGTLGAIVLPNISGSMATPAYLKASSTNTGLNAPSGATGATSGTTSLGGTGTAVASSTHTHAPGSIELENITRRAYFRQ